MQGKFMMLLLLLFLVFMIACDKDYHYIEFKSPQPDSILSGFVPIEVELNGPDYSNRVDYLLNDSLIGTLILPNYTYIINTFAFPGGDAYQLVVELSDYNNEFLDSDTLSFGIDNGYTVYAEDFEFCTTYSYPFYHGWYEIWPGDYPHGAYIAEDQVFEGFHSLKLVGVSDTVRTDGVDLLLSEANEIVYELMVMIPDNSYTGAYVGFWYRLGPTLGTIYNGVLLNPSDHKVQVRGIDVLPTDYQWIDNAWHNIRVRIDYLSGVVDFWIDDSLIAADLPAADKSLSRVFALSTVAGTHGAAYFDNIVITRDSL